MADTLRSILFWYYKEPSVCRERLIGLRRLNPEAQFFGLYGGEEEDFKNFSSLSELLDDNWQYRSDQSPDWKWRNGDLMLSEWFTARGTNLVWKSLVVVQWDILFRRPVQEVFRSIDHDKIYLPGLRRLSEVEAFWGWCVHGGRERPMFEAYLESLNRRRFAGELWACQFVLAVFPREFLKLYADIPERELGFLEYKIPTYAVEMGFELAKVPALEVEWESDPQRVRRVTLSARKAPIEPLVILLESLSTRGARVFHPVTRSYKLGLFGVFFDLIFTSVLKGGRKIKRHLSRGFGAVLRTR